MVPIPASCCGQPRVSKDLDRCYDCAVMCEECGDPADDSNVCPTCKERKEHEDTF